MKKILSMLIVSLFILASCGNRAPVDIINPDAEYLYFFGASCPHCQELNRIAEERDLYSQISIEKREVYNNAENRDIFLALIEEIQPDSDGVPFVYDKVTGEVAVGVRPALEMMTSRLNKVASPSVVEETEPVEVLPEEEVPSETTEIEENIEDQNETVELEATASGSAN